MSGVLDYVRGLLRRPAPSPAAKAEEGLPRWRELIESDRDLWRKSLARAETGPRVLVATSVGGFNAVTIVESLLGVALTLRGAQVRFLLCDADLPACLHVNWKKLPDPTVVRDYTMAQGLCQGCIGRGRGFYGETGLPLSTFGDFLRAEDREEARRLAQTMSLDEIAAYEPDGLKIGEQAKAGALRFLSRGQLPDDETGDWTLRRYFEAALLSRVAVERAVDDFKPDVAVFHHGIYIPQGVIGEIARKRSVRVVNWQVAYRKKCFIFSHHETYHHTLLSEPTAGWENMPWSPHIEETIDNYLRSRWYGTNDWIWFHNQPKHDASAIAAELGIDFGKPTVTLLTNVFWDAQLHYRANAFKDMLDWLLQSIEYFARRPDLQAVIRIHPAEIRGAIPSRQKLTDEIAARYPTLPPNVFIVPPESDVSTYVLCESSDAVVIYGTKTGVELTARGIPVIVAGEAWIRNKGMTLDAVSPEAYFRLLDELPLRRRLDEATVARAKRYAFHFFFRRFVPLEFVEPAQGSLPYTLRLDSLKDLLPAKDPGLDVLCEGILKGREFVYEAERYV
jgi:hypothetical protein